MCVNFFARQARLAYRELRAARATIQQCLAYAQLPAFTTAASFAVSNPSPPPVDLATPSPSPSAVTSAGMAATNSSSTGSSSSSSGGVASPPGVRRLLKQAAVVAAVLQRKTDAANAAQLAQAEEEQLQQQQQQQHYPQAAMGGGGALPYPTNYNSSHQQHGYPQQRLSDETRSGSGAMAGPGGAAKSDLKKLFSVLSSAKAQKLGSGGR